MEKEEQRPGNRKCETPRDERKNDEPKEGDHAMKL